MPEQTLRICSLYPDVMNIYADRGNITVLEQRCRWRGIDVEISGSGSGQTPDPDAYDLFYLGGGQDRDQELVAADLLQTKAESLRRAAAKGAVVLGICGGIQLLGHHYELGNRQIPGLGLLDLTTHRGDGARLIGNIAIEAELEPGEKRLLAGFENHGGRTVLGPGCEPLGRVLKGHGNDGRSGVEGARQGTVLGTYLHGPLLPKNAWFADWLIATALSIDPTELAILDDELEARAHADALSAAGVQRAGAA